MTTSIKRYHATHSGSKCGELVSHSIGSTGQLDAISGSKESDQSVMFFVKRVVKLVVRGTVEASRRVKGGEIPYLFAELANYLLGKFPYILLFC